MSDEDKSTDNPKIGIVLATIITALITAIAIGFFAFGFKDWLNWDTWQSVTLGPDDKIISKERDFSIVMRNIGLLVMAILALGFASWRSIIAHRQAVTAIEQLALSESGNLMDRFLKAIGMLNNEDHSIKIAGVLFLRNLSEENPDRIARNALEILSSFVVKRSQQHHHVIENTPTEERRNIDSPPPDLTAAFEALPIIRDKCAFLTKQETQKFFKLKNTDFSGYIIFNLDFGGADLRNVKFAGAMMNETNFNDTTITPIDASQSAFVNCSFENAFLAGGHICDFAFTGANFSNSNFSYAPSLTQDQLDQGWVWKDCEPQFPFISAPNLTMHNLAPTNIRDDYNDNQRFGFPKKWKRPTHPSEEI